MTTARQMTRLLVGVTCVVLEALNVSAQEMAVDFIASPFGVEEPVVVGAPYSAKAVTEVVQTLSDGNRIARQSTVSVYRDGIGRTRREQGLAVIGAMVGDSSGPRQIVINDPQSRVAHILDPDARIAHRLNLPGPALAGAQRAADVVPFDIPVPPPGSGVPAQFFVQGIRGVEALPAAAVEQLGRQVIEGVEVEGSRSTVTIPAGQIGNDQAVSIVSERWYSPELRVLVRSRRSDPRFGDTSYRLTDIVRAEPGAWLFEVPSDFRVSDPGIAGDVFYLPERR